MYLRWKDLIKKLHPLTAGLHTYQNLFTN